MKNILKQFEKLATPIYKELPYIVLFIILMANSFLHAWILYINHICILFLFAYIGATIICATKPRIARITIKILFYTIAVLLNAIKVFLISNFLLEISPTCFMLLAETTGNESREFIEQYILSDAIIPTLRITALYIGAIILFEIAWYYIKHKVNNFPRICNIALSTFAITTLSIGIYSSQIYIDIYNAESPDHIRFIKPPKDPASSTYSSIITIKKMGESLNKFTETNKQAYNINSYTSDCLPINIVVVIGESYIKYHSQLYGYSLKTTPCLIAEEKAGRLFVFNDAITSSNSTSIVMRNILCCNNSSDNEKWYNHPNFLTIFKKAGYNVYYWDNQLNFDTNATYSFTLNSFLFHPELYNITYTTTNNTSYKYDKELIDSFKKTVELTTDSKNLIVFHLMGQHHNANERFPNDTFTHFKADSIKKTATYLGQEEKEYIASYDNATLYNDYVIKEIIETYKNSNTIIVYFSDHGEEVYDYRNQCNRDHGEMTANKLKYQFDIPFVIWCSDEYKQKQPESITNIKNAINRPFIIDNLCHLLFNVGGIITPFYRDSLDLISPNYKNKERIINHIYNYEDIRYSTKEQ